MLPLTTITFSSHTQLSFSLGGGGGSGMPSEKRVAIDFLKLIWHEWEPPGVVLLSLTIQVFLIIMGKRRRFTYGRLSTFFTWIAYLSADAVAVYAIGIITTRVARAQNPKSEPSIHLNAFWAPFLLLHLGGPETITAYSLEDNELWSRHLLSMCTQACMSLYVFVATWNGSVLSFLTVGMLLAGLIKYGERVCVLWFASSERFRRSIPDSPFVRSKVFEEQLLMEAEGFRAMKQRQVNEIPLQVDILQIDSNPTGIPDDILIQEELSIAEELLRIFQRVFVDFSLFSGDRDASIALLEGKNVWSIFKIIEIELGLMFDVLYTKAKVAASKWGAISRSTTMLITVVVAAVFSSLEAHPNPYTPADFRTTLVLLGGAIFLEGYAFSILVFSDKTACWLIKNRKLNTLKFINMLQPLSKKRRWSSVVSQFSILSYSLREKHPFYNCLLKYFDIDERIYKYKYRTYETIPTNLKWLIMERTTTAMSFAEDNGTDFFPGDSALNSLEKGELMWSLRLEFDQSIIVWHIATELVLNSADDENHARKSEKNFSCTILSRYMMYLLVHHPQMLPTPKFTSIKFKDTYIEATNFFDGMRRDDMARRSRRDKLKELRQNMIRDLHVKIAKKDRSKLLLLHGCYLASQIDKYNKTIREEIICNVWIEKLIFAAKDSNSLYHSKQLRMGGELLTHVWLFMAHFGFTRHFQKLEDFSIVDLIVT